MAKANRKMAVYQITNLVNNKFYIGSSANLYERWRKHRNKLRSGTHPNKYIQASWNKYGERAFIFEIVAEFEAVEDMLAYEEGLIQKHLGSPLCMNLAKWVDSPMRGRTGKTHPNYGKAIPEATKELLRKATLRQWDVSDPRTGKTHSEEVKAKISQKVQEALAQGKGGKFIPSEETRRKMSESLKGNQIAKGYKRTEKEKEAIKQRMLGNKNWLGKTHTEEAKEKMSKKVVAVAPDGEETVYVSITALRKEFGLTSPSVNNPLKSGKPISKGKMKGWSFKYLAPQA